MDAQMSIRDLQNQLQQSHNEKEALARRLAKKSAQLDLAHTAVNDMQNKMDLLAAEQR